MLSHRAFISLVRTTGLLVITAWLAACASRPVYIQGEADAALQRQLTALQQWKLSGKLAVRAADLSESARIQWQQEAQRYDIQLSGPAGIKATHIYGTQHSAHFEQGDTRLVADSAEALSQQLIGWPLPARELTWWLRGLPAPDYPVQAARYTQTGWLTQLSQGGWQIDFSEPHTVNTHLILPGKIEARRGDTHITLIIKQWQVD